MLFGYTRLPWINYITEIVSARSPIIKNGELSILVENHGQVTSHPTYLAIERYNDQGMAEEVVTMAVPEIDPYKGVTLSASSANLKVGEPIIVKILTREGNPTLFNTTVNGD